MTPWIRFIEVSPVVVKQERSVSKVTRRCRAKFQYKLHIVSVDVLDHVR